MTGKLNEIDSINICNDYLLGVSYKLLSEKYSICTWILNFFKSKGMETTPKISKRKNIYSVQVNSKLDIELIENIIYTSSSDYYLKRKI